MCYKVKSTFLSIYADNRALVKELIEVTLKKTADGKISLEKNVKDIDFSSIDVYLEKNSKADIKKISIKNKEDGRFYINIYYSSEKCQKLTFTLLYVIKNISWEIDNEVFLLPEKKLRFISWGTVKNNTNHSFENATVTFYNFNLDMEEHGYSDIEIKEKMHSLIREFIPKSLTLKKVNVDKYEWVKIKCMDVIFPYNSIYEMENVLFIDFITDVVPCERSCAEVKLEIISKEVSSLPISRGKYRIHKGSIIRMGEINCFSPIIFISAGMDKNVILESKLSKLENISKSVVQFKVYCSLKNKKNEEVLAKATVNLAHLNELLLENVKNLKGTVKKSEINTYNSSFCITKELPPNTILEFELTFKGYK